MVEKQGIMMENYQEQYNQELHQQEINSNLRTLKGYFWIVVTMLVLWLLTLTRIFIVDAGIFTHGGGIVHGHGYSCFVHIQKSRSVEALGKICVFNTDLRDFCNLRRLFVFSCGAYLCIAFTFGSAVSEETDALDHLCSERCDHDHQHGGGILPWNL